MVTLGVPGGRLIGSALEDPIPGPGKGASFPLIGGGRGGAGNILLLELLSPWKQSWDRSVSMERAASLERSEEPHCQDLLPDGLNGTGRSQVTDMTYYPMPKGQCQLAVAATWEERF